MRLLGGQAVIAAVSLTAGLYFYKGAKLRWRGRIFRLPDARLVREMRLRSAVAVAIGLSLALIGSRAFADPTLPRAAGAEAKCAADNFSGPATTSDAPLCRHSGKSGKVSAGAPRLQFPQVWQITAASAWEAFPAPGLSAAVSGTHPFANGGAGSAAAGAKLDGKPSPVGQSAATPKWSFTGDIGIPNNHSLEDVLRQQYRGPAAMDNESVAEKFVNAIGALKLGIKVDY